jgi:hypothetical protein
MNSARSVAGRCRTLSAILVGLILPALPGISQVPSARPEIHFGAPIFDFGKAMAGDLIRHDFVFTNVGNSTLDITGVNPSCSCTSPMDWTHRVEPGQTGQISLQVDTKRLSGRVSEVAGVASSDPAHRKVTLSFVGTVWKPVDVSPWTVILRPVSESGEGASNASEIIVNLPDSITIGNPVSDNPAFQPELKIVVEGKKFRLTVHSAPINSSTMMHGNISMRTSSATVPSIIVPVLAIPQSPLVLSPAVLYLPRGPLLASTNETVSLRNDGRNEVNLTAAKIDVPGAEVEFKEARPGREFTFNLTFPAGFKLPEGREAALTITLTNSLTPVLKVPLRPVQPAAARGAVSPGAAAQKH